MYRKNAVNKFLSATALSIFVILSCVDAFASDRGRGSNSGRDNGHDRDFNRGRKHEVVVVGRERYNYHDGRFFRPSWFGFEFFVSRPPFGAVVMSIPIGHRAVIIGGAQYYHYDNIYYKPCPSGYIVVPPPAVVTNPSDTVTINVPNSNGSYTSITLVKRDNGYFGPQGEYYPDHPTVDQLRALYGK
jgi:hypothetical protein